MQLEHRQVQSFYLTMRKPYGVQLDITKRVLYFYVNRLQKATAISTSIEYRVAFEEC